jgi:hypothetical protein
MGDDTIRSKVQVVACLATAGPVNTTKNNVYMTNMGKGGQSIDGNAIEECQDGLLSIVVRCKLVNDFVGQGEREYTTSLLVESLDNIFIVRLIHHSFYSFVSILYRVWKSRS